MKIFVAGNVFNLSDKSDVNVNGYDLKITEPGFDKESSKIKAGRFVNRPIGLPGWIRVKNTNLDPCSGLYEDKNGKLQFSAYYD